MLFTLSLILLAQPSATVTLYRDTWGVPHLYADREEAGFYGLGYAQAEDQLTYLLSLIVLARGEASAALGPEHLESDFSSRLWRHAAEGKAGFAKMSHELQRNYRAFVAGVTQFMTEHPDKVPAWAPKLDPWDPVIVSRWLLWGSYQVGDGLRDCVAGGVKIGSFAMAQLGSGAHNASNEWIIAPWRTADGVMIVNSDPHGGIDGSFVHEFRMHAGRLEMAGYAMGAMPLLTHNRRVSWGMTTGAPDVSDCYEVQVDPANPREFLFDGKKQRMTVETVTITPKGGKPVTRTLEYTHHNGVLSPVVARAAGRAYVVSTTYMHDGGVFDEELYRMNLAHNVAEVREAMKLLGMFPQNVMVGDADGNSWYVRAGKAPRRPAGFDWTKPVPGNDSRSGWLGIHPLEDLVQVSNPPGGFMQNDNVSPARMFPGSPLTPGRYPAYIYNDDSTRTNSRGRRTVEVLSRTWHATVADAIELALDQYWIDTPLWQRLLAAAARQSAAEMGRKPADFRSALASLLTFDGQARKESATALLWLVWRERLVLEQTALKDAADRVAKGTVDDSLPEGTRAGLLGALQQAVDSLRPRPGQPAPTIGDRFRLERGKYNYPVGGVAMAPPDLKLCGSMATWDKVCIHTLRAFTAGAPDSTGRRTIFLGSRLLRLVIFTDPIQSFTVHNFGQTSDSTSPHYADQAKLSSEHGVKPVWFERSELMQHLESTRVLEVPATLFQIR